MHHAQRPQLKALHRRDNADPGDLAEREGHSWHFQGFQIEFLPNDQQSATDPTVDKELH